MRSKSSQVRRNLKTSYLNPGKYCFDTPCTDLLKRHLTKTITKKCFDSKLVSNRLFHVSNWFIRAKSAQEKKKKFDLPQKQSVSKAKLGRTCVILSSWPSRRPQRKRLRGGLRGGTTALIVCNWDYDFSSRSF